MTPKYLRGGIFWVYNNLNRTIWPLGELLMCRRNVSCQQKVWKSISVEIKLTGLVKKILCPGEDGTQNLFFSLSFVTSCQVTVVAQHLLSHTHPGDWPPSSQWIDRARYIAVNLNINVQMYICAIEEKPFLKTLSTLSADREIFLP